ncbi:hypoxia up-regulated protein 1 isoform X3 [Lingula anatina]|uniref:Hypoxia up-regulated protein 1 n=1 Tax=Lingula anatina TaxID=7574 RepID=A0A1S3IKU2_LINAN|nr:hypoxia up-regulated protein 1 isoform X3 [Lingula anatina]|eukprot:XP_013398865.1 hypoxia up-regulated protein 1 isoform X3 [Lingula anatina]
MRQSTKILAALLLLGYLWTSAEGMAVMSVDLGNEFMKIAIVKPGVPMEIVLNKESRRKTPVVVAFRNNEREFGDQAMNTAVRYPANAFLYLKDLLGKKVDNPVVKHYQQRFPYHNIVPSDTGTVMFQIDEVHLRSPHSKPSFGNTKYSVEELLGMVLQEAKHLAEGFAEQPISDVVITVPPFFNQAERRAMNLAAEYAGLKLLQLMNDNSAVALNYGVFRRKEFNGTAQHYMFFDMGATSTIVTIVGYQLVKTKEGSYTETNPQVTVKGVGFDRDLGGLEFQLRFRDHLARLFNGQKKTSSDVFQDKRAMGKLFKEAGRVKNVLSANTDHFAQVESLLDDQDFKAKVTREELEEMSQDMLDRVAKPIEDALKVSQMTMGEIKEVILMGGGTRMPKVQELISKATGRQELGKSINTDEAAALGAVYQAAFLSKGYRVKKFLVKDANLYPIQVEFERQKEGEAVKTIKRTLFGRMNPYPQKKVMTFNKHTEDFNFRVNYGDLSYLDEVDVKNFDSLNLTKVTLKGVKAAHEKHSKDAESKGVKAHFRMDESGILTLDRVESVYEKAPPPEEESTLAKLGNTISNFFSGKSEEEGNVEDSKEKDDKGKENGGEKSTDSKDDTSEQDKKEKKQSDKAKEEEKEKKEEKTENKKDTKAQKEEVKNEKKEEKTDQKKDETPKEGKADKGEQKGNETTDKKDGDAAKNETAEEKKPPKPVTIKEEITPESEILDLLPPSEDAVKASIKVLEKLKQKDEDKIKLQQAHNALESFIFDAQDKLYQEPYEQASTEEERSMLREKLTAASDWLDESDVTNTIQEFKDQLKTLKDATYALYERVREHSERPKALEALKDMLNYTDMFYKGVKNLTESLDDQPYTEVEVTTLEKLINETKSWQKTNIKAQKDTPLTDKPVLLVEDIAVKIRALDREVKYLMNKAKTFVPKKPVKPKNETETPGNETKIETPNNETKSEEEGPAEGQDSTTPGTEEPVEQPPPPTEEENKNNEEKSELPESEETDKTGKEDKSSESKETDSKKDDEHIEL